MKKSTFSEITPEDRWCCLLFNAPYVDVVILYLLITDGITRNVSIKVL